MRKMSKEEKLTALKERMHKLETLRKETREFIQFASHNRDKACKDITEMEIKIMNLREFILTLPQQVDQAKYKLTNQENSIEKLKAEIAGMTVHDRLVRRRRAVAEEMRRVERELIEAEANA